MTLVLHRPLGGHAYRVEPDQRFPVHPLVGEPCELRVLADLSVVTLTVEFDSETGRRTEPLAMFDVDDLYGPGTDAEGHLMEVSRATPDLGGRQLWAAVLPAGSGGAVCSTSYRFVAIAADGHQETTEWFGCTTTNWQSDGGQLRLIGDGPRAGSRLVAGRTSWKVGAAGPVAVRFALRIEAAEHVIGFGERFDHLDQRGHVLDTTVFEQYQQQGARTYLPSPFAIVAGGEGWGFHVRTSRRVWFDVGVSEPELLWVEVALDPALPELQLRVHDGAPGEVLAAHLGETGMPAMPPEWVFRPWMSANDWNTQARVVQEVQRSLDLDVPVGVVVIEAWSDESTFTVFRDTQYEVQPDGAPLSLADMTFPVDGAWPDPLGMTEWLHANGVKLVLWQIPLVPVDRGDRGQVAADARTMIERGYCVHAADGQPYHNRGWWFPAALLPDWTNDEARAWWLAKRRYLLTEMGIDGFKTDGGEHAWGDDLRYADGARGDAGNNLFALRYSQAYHELIAEAGADATTFSRAGFTGVATAPCHWAGDESSTWEAFRASVVAGLTAGASGVVFWGWDLAGFSGEIPSVELYVRATAMAALCPIMQYHAEFDAGRLPSHDRTPWNIAERHGDERALTVYRRFAHLRERLRPYLVEQARRCVEYGWPMMRPLCFDHPDDARVWEHPFQYHLGDALLVAPIVEPGATAVQVYLPAGRWTDVWTGEVHDGPTVVQRVTPWDDIAVFARQDPDADAAPAVVEAFRDIDLGNIRG